MLRKIVTLLCAGLIVSACAENTDKLDAIQKSLEKIISKAGISFGGEFKSECLTSEIGGEGANDTTARQKENNSYTSVDFDINARPNEMINARVMFRMHQNWQNFFSDVSNPIFTRWISIDGNVKNMFTFSAGDFKQKFSSLTLYNPDVDILYEPTIFARQKELAMNELFLGDNKRALQGINMSFDAEVAPIFNEFHLALIGSRLRSSETCVQSGSFVANSLEKSPDMSKYFVGSNLDATFLKGVNLGGTWLEIFDSKASSKATSKKGNDTIADTSAQRTAIYSVRPGVDIAKIIDNESLTLNIMAEMAFSNDDSAWVATESGKHVLKETTISGSAIKAGGVVGFASGDAWGVQLNGDFIMNSKDFRNELAQSPSFIGDRIMNMENSDRSNYSTFDALYHNVFKFTPASGGDSGQYWIKSPFRKISYWRSVFTQNELAGAVDTNMDPALQLVMPYGPATPNRVGINANFKGFVLNRGIEVTALLASLEEKDEIKYKRDSTKFIPKAKFSQVGGGVKVDISKFVSALKYPLELSGSYVLSTANRDEFDTVYTKYSVNSSFLNSGLYYKFWKRTAVLAGYQLISNKLTGKRNTNSTVETEVAMTNWSVGFEWSVSDGADVVASMGQILIDKGETLENSGKKDVYQTLFDLSMCVKF